MRASVEINTDFFQIASLNNTVKLPCRIALLRPRNSIADHRMINNSQLAQTLSTKYDWQAAILESLQAGKPL